MTEDISDKYHDLLFSVKRSAKYHKKRQQFFEWYERFIKIIITLSSLGIFITILSKMGEAFTLVVSAIVAFFATIDLIVRTSDSARLHSDLARRFLNLEKNMIQEDDKNISDKKLKSFQVERLEIESDEPAKKAILDIICHNELCKAMGYSVDEQVNLRFYQRWAANYCDIGLQSTSKNNEIQ